MRRFCGFYANELLTKLKTTEHHELSFEEHVVFFFQSTCNLQRGFSVKHIILRNRFNKNFQKNFSTLTENMLKYEVKIPVFSIEKWAHLPLAARGKKFHQLKYA